MYKETIEQASEYLRLILPLMTKYKVPPHPTNYAVWYEYATKKNKALTDEIDQKINRMENFTEEVNHKLYQHHLITLTPKQTNKIRDKLQSIFNELLNTLSNKDGEYLSYTTILEEAAENLVENLNPTVLRKTIIQILDETQHIKNSNNELKRQLELASKELIVLRTEFERVKNEATKDPLTNLFNRKAFDDALSLAIKAAQQTQSNLSLLMIDIDHFKKINDSFGHLIGDEVLKVVAAIIKKNTKTNDITARYGGEEFAVILPSTDINQAILFAETVRQRLNAQEIKRKSTMDNIGKISVSIGVTKFNANTDSIDSFIRRADNALYEAKQAGRNKVIEK